MPIIIRDKTYPVPGEEGVKGPTGTELAAIEDHYDLDGVMLISSLAQENPPKHYTRAKAIYSMAWIVLTRAGEIVSIKDVLDEYSIDDFAWPEEEPKKEVTESSEMAEPTDS
jgi:hypothetical protein